MVETLERIAKGSSLHVQYDKALSQEILDWDYEILFSLKLYMYYNQLICPKPIGLMHFHCLTQIVTLCNKNPYHGGYEIYK